MSPQAPLFGDVREKINIPNMKLIIGNWKMNFPKLSGWKNFSAPKNVEAVICPPFPYLAEVKKVINIKLGAQDMFWEENGAFTGEVSPSMLREFGVEYAIIGHSERRRWLGETDEMINKKILASVKAGLNIILCVGESAKMRKRGIKAAKEFVGDQLRKDLKGIEKLSTEGESASGGQIKNLTVAYEPIWAIGTGEPDKPKDSNEMAGYIKSQAKSHKSRVLYGGSVTSKNAAEFLEQKEIDGALVGGASLDQNEFQKIAILASKL